MWRGTLAIALITIGSFFISLEGIGMAPAAAQDVMVTDAQITHTIIDVGHGKPAPRPAPVPLADCETVASPIADPTLSRIVGRCFV
jgi:hypothetical protein